jgi:hypothetical protein
MNKMNKMKYYIKIPKTPFFKNLIKHPIRKIIASLLMFTCLFSIQFLILEYDWGLAFTHSLVISILFTTF